MKGLLEERVQDPWRTVLLLPTALLAGLLLFFLVGLTNTLGFALSLVIGLALGTAGAVALLGPPRIQIPRVEVPPGVREHREWFFPLLALVLGAIVYVLAGLAYTMVEALPAGYGSWAALVLALVAGPALAYLLVGAPSPVPPLRDAWARVPEERRPWLTVPLGLLLATVLFLLLGLAWTALPLPTAAMVPGSLALALLLGFGIAAALLGVPTPQRSPRELVPEVPARARPVAFLVTLLVLGPVLAFLVGIPLSRLASVLPSTLLFPLSLLLGYLLAFVASAAWWGLPGRWKGVPVPGVPEDVRLALLLPLALAGGAVLAFLLELLLPIGLFPSILVGGSLGLLLALRATGATQRVRPRNRTTLLPDLPDTVKPLVLLPLTLVLGTLLFFTLGYVGLGFAWSLALGGSIGLALALALVEEPLLRQVLHRRRQRRARRQLIEERRAELLEDARSEEE